MAVPLNPRVDIKSWFQKIISLYIDDERGMVFDVNNVIENIREKYYCKKKFCDINFEFYYLPQNQEGLFACSVKTEQTGLNEIFTDYIYTFQRNPLMVIQTRADYYTYDNLLKNENQMNGPFYLSDFLYKQMIDFDNGVPVIDSAIGMNSRIFDKDFVEDCVENIVRENRCLLPIIYFPYRNNIPYNLDFQKVADQVQCQAHVVVAPDSLAAAKVSKEMQKEKIALPREGEYFFISYPKIKEKAIYKYSQFGDEQGLLAGIQNNIGSVQKKFGEIFPYSVPKIKQEIELRLLEKEINESERKLIEEKKLFQNKDKRAENIGVTQKQIEDFIASFDEENGNLKKQNKILRKKIETACRKIYDLQTENEMYSSEMSEVLCNQEEDSLKISGDGIENYYPQEIKDAILVTCQKELKNKDAKSRIYEILNWIVQNNELGTIGKRFFDNIREIFENAPNRLNASDLKALERLGFEIETEGKHYKLKYGRFSFTVAKTPSDRRWNKNIISYINRDLNIYR